jgi:hypothetical protein
VSSHNSSHISAKSEVCKYEKQLMDVHHNTQKLVLELKHLQTSFKNEKALRNLTLTEMNSRVLKISDKTNKHENDMKQTCTDLDNLICSISQQGSKNIQKFNQLTTGVGKLSDNLDCLLAVRYDNCRNCCIFMMMGFVLFVGLTVFPSLVDNIWDGFLTPILL